MTSKSLDIIGLPTTAIHNRHQTVGENHLIIADTVTRKFIMSKTIYF